MADVPEAPLSRTLALLVCPVCHGQLRVLPESVGCAGCGRSYPVRDGIPVLIAGEASPPRYPSGTSG